MSNRYYDTPGSDDTVRLLSNPLNNENLQTDEFESPEEAKSNVGIPFCSTCCSVSVRDVNNISHGYIDNDHPVASTLSNDCHHCHQVLPTHLNPHSRSKLVLALCLCLVFMAAEMVGGYIAGSVAVVSDGAHLLTDVVGFLISLIAISTSKKKCTKAFNLGFYRIEVLTTLTSILLIWVMTGVFMYIAATRLIGGVYTIEVNTMIVISSLGVLINIAMFLVLHGSCHPKHIHSHHMPIRETAKGGQNINVRAAIIHVIGDLVQSIGVFVSSIVIKFYNAAMENRTGKTKTKIERMRFFMVALSFQPSAKFMDPVCTFLFSIVVLCSTLKLLKESIYILMEGFPRNCEYSNILMSLQGLNGVRHVHSLCVWSLTLDKNVLLVHLAVDDSVDRDVILFQAQRIISTKFGINTHTIQIEKYHPKCMHACQSCRPLWG